MYKLLKKILEELKDINKKLDAGTPSLNDDLRFNMLMDGQKITFRRNRD